MTDFLDSVQLVDLVDIAVVAVLIYRVLLLIKGTRAFQVLSGLMVLAAIYGVSRALQLSTVIWLFESGRSQGSVPSSRSSAIFATRRCE